MSRGHGSSTEKASETTSKPTHEINRLRPYHPVHWGDPQNRSRQWPKYNIIDRDGYIINTREFIKTSSRTAKRYSYSRLEPLFTKKTHRDKRVTAYFPWLVSGNFVNFPQKPLKSLCGSVHPGMTLPFKVASGDPKFWFFVRGLNFFSNLRKFEAWSYFFRLRRCFGNRKLTKTMLKTLFL